MITYKSPREIEIMRAGGRIVAGAFKLAQDIIRPGISTKEIDHQIEHYVRQYDGEMAFKGYRGYPGNTCISVNEEVVHGIPGPKKLVAGDIVSIDIGVRYKNYYADAAMTFPVGHVAPKVQCLIDITQKALDRAIEKIKPDIKLSELSKTIQDFVEANGFSVVRNFVGHGIGAKMHEEPQIPNYVTDTDDPADDEIVLKPGMVLAIEPMVNEGTWEVESLPDGWTVVTKDRKPSAHFEHTVAVTARGREILTRM